MKIYLLMGLLAFVQSIRWQDESRIREEWASVIEEIARKHRFNGSVVLADNEGLIIQRNFGFTSRDSTHLINDSHRYNIGSIAKHLCSEGLLQLIEEGKVNYSDPVSKFINELPPWKDDLTIGELLQYRGGLPSRNLRLDYTDQNFWQELNELDGLNAKNFQYSNYCNFLQAKIIEKITGGPLRDFVKTEILDNYGMKNSIYEKYPPLKDSLLLRGFSDAYGDDIRNNPFTLKFDLCYAPIYMTPQDLALWIKNIVNKYSIANEKVREMYNTDEEIGPFGVFALEEGHIEKYETAGQAYGFLVTGNYIGKSSLTLVVASNYRDSQVLEIRDSILHKFGE